MKRYVGLGGSLHDFSASVLGADGSLFTAEVERLTRQRYAVSQADEHSSAVAYLASHLGFSPSEASVIADDMISRRFFPDRTIINHHDAHALSSLVQSPFEEAAILVVDGVGSSRSDDEPETRETISYYRGAGNAITLLGRVYGRPTSIRVHRGSPRVRTNSIGDWYRFFTEILGFGFLQAGKTMGLSPYGSGKYHGQLDAFCELGNGGNVTFRYEHDRAAAFLELVGHLSLDEGLHQPAADLAALAQYGAERALAHCAEWLRSTTGLKNICITGGVAQNSIAMGKMERWGLFDRVFVDQAPGDAGVAIGAAISGYLADQGADQLLRLHPGAFTQLCPEEDKVGLALKRGLASRKTTNQEVAQLISEGAVVATHFGHAEFGARALGHRSLLADPRSSGMRDKLNHIKGREWFRPVAPCVLKGRSSEYFNTNLDCEFMQYVVEVLEARRATIPSAVHVDGTARVQIVAPSNTPLWDVLESFEKITGVPVLLNTSFNVAGRAIVHSFEDALDDYLAAPIDALFFGDQLICRQH